MNHLHFGEHQPYQCNDWSYSGQILYTGSIYQVPACGWQITLKTGVVRVTWPAFVNFGPNHIFGSGEARNFKCRVRIDTEEYWCMRDKLSQKWMCSGHVTSLNFIIIIIIRFVKRQNVKRLPWRHRVLGDKWWYLGNGAKSSHTCNRRQIGNRIWPIEWHHYRWPWE